MFKKNKLFSEKKICCILFLLDLRNKFDIRTEVRIYYYLIGNINEFFTN
jgi:hypothetical protein